MEPETSSVKTISIGLRGRSSSDSGGKSMSVKYPPAPAPSPFSLSLRHQRGFDRLAGDFVAEDEILVGNFIFRIERHARDLPAGTGQLDLVVHALDLLNLHASVDV